jgi:hypothetical protein
LKVSSRKAANVRTCSAGRCVALAVPKPELIPEKVAGIVKDDSGSFHVILGDCEPIFLTHRHARAAIERHFTTTCAVHRLRPAWRSDGFKEQWTDWYRPPQVPSAADDRSWPPLDRELRWRR